MRERKPLPIIEEIKSDLPPQHLFRNISDRPYSFFLDSAKDPERLGRFSVMGCDPFLVFKSKRDNITLEGQDGGIERFKSDPFLALKKVFKRYEVSRLDKRLPFVGGGVGYFSYDMKNFIEHLPDYSMDDLEMPDCILGFYDAAVIFDNLDNKCYLMNSGLRAGESAGLLKEKIREPVIKEDPVFIPGSLSLESNFSMGSYMETIKKAKAYIKKGDIYQVNLSQRFETELGMDPFDLYMRLRAISPAPFAAYLNFGDCAIASSSPERFLFKRRDYVETRPIKGTRPRGEDAFSDALLEDELIHSPKDMAEHVMIVDLERNDLGRVCRYGSVRPSEFVVLEKYANVFHLVSTVSGRLRRGIGPIDCLLAAFPGGSITGAPKIRAMEIIDQLEPVKRSVYTGAIGYISFDGDMDTSIAIRTFIIRSGRAYFSVGGGIVADSDPEAEYYETIDKARGLMTALGINVDKPDKVLV